MLWWRCVAFRALTTNTLLPLPPNVFPDIHPIYSSIFYIYHLIRRPTHILDFSVTLVFNHIVLTTYYASSFPTSLFFWAVIVGSAAMQIIWAEQLCVRREMKEGFILGQGWKTDERAEDLPQPHNLPRRQRRNSAPSAVGYDRIPMVELGGGG